MLIVPVVTLGDNNITMVFCFLKFTLHFFHRWCFFSTSHIEGKIITDSCCVVHIFRDTFFGAMYLQIDDTITNGNINNSSNPNGSLNGIAGITNKEGNVLGMMPHPERVSEKVCGGE